MPPFLRSTAALIHQRLVATMPRCGSVLLYNTAIRGPPSMAAWRRLEAQYDRCARDATCLSLGPNEDQHVATRDVYARARAPSLHVALTATRLRYLGRLLRHAPPAVFSAAARHAVRKSRDLPRALGDAPGIGPCVAIASLQ